MPSVAQRSAKYGKMAGTTFLALCLLLSGCSGKGPGPLPAPEPEPFPLLLRPDGSPVTPAEFRVMVTDYDYILVGEEHPNPCSHQAQAALLRETRRAFRAAAARGQTHRGVPLTEPVLALEMLPAEINPRLEELPRAPGVLARLDEALPPGSTWRDLWGYPFSLYRPVFEQADAHGPGVPPLPVRGLNLPQRVTQAAARGGLDAVAPRDRALLPPEILPLTPEQAQALAPVLEAHQKAAVTRSADGFALVMRLWDSAMGWQAAALNRATDRPVFILAGAGHTRNDWGIRRAIEYFDASSVVLTVTPLLSEDRTPRAGQTAAPGGTPEAQAPGLVPPAPSDLLYVCPPAVAPRPRLGLSLSVRDGRMGVEAVRPGSSAEAAGFRPGDLILAINGKTPARVMDLHAAALRTPPGEAMRFLVQRADGSRILLRAMLRPAP